MDAEGIEVDEAEVDKAIAELAGRSRVAPAELRRRLERAGRLSAVRSDQAKSKALAWLLDHVDFVDEEGNPVTRDELKMAESAVQVDAEPSNGPQGREVPGADEVQSQEAGR